MSFLPFSDDALEFDPKAAIVAPSPHLVARETSALAAIEQHCRRSTQSAQILALIRAAGETGISDLELHRASGAPRQSICARRRDLRGLITVADGRYTDPQSKRSYCRWRMA